MITINHISFEFVMADEQFTQNLYADWDNFCYTCFEKVVEECLYPYNKDMVLCEIETLDLDLGNIPEEDFYQEFPRRLKEELLRVLPLFNISAKGQEERVRTSRLENLLFCLEHSYPKTEWADRDFSLAEELGWAVTLYANEIARLCLRKEYALRRLLWQTDDETVLLRIYTAALTEPSSGLHEKRRFLGILLEIKPDISVYFIHEATDEVNLHCMSELLDNLFVSRIIETETKEHAEVDLSPYWHYLYEWLVKYYPFNGLAIFGDKGDFIRHLHYSLLTFIRKRNYSFYLSKAELTKSFLVEVFGAAQYIEVLNAIYELQPRHTDGSPMYDGYLNRELYNIFSQLSLLRKPETKREVVDGNNEKNINNLITELNMSEKNFMNTNLTATQLLKSMAQTNFRQASVLSQTIEWLQHKADKFSFLTGNNMLLSTALSKAMLLYMQDKDMSGSRVLTESEIVEKFLSHLYFVYTGKSDYQDHTEWTDLSVEVTADLKTDGWQGMQKKETTNIRSHKDTDDAVPNGIKEGIVQSFKSENDPMKDKGSEYPDYIFIENAGLCLFSPWFLQLFYKLGYLTENRRDFKDTASSIRAIFMLQYLISMEEKEYKETDLAFNRLLVALPMNIPLPRQLELTNEEKKVAESLLLSVKANWQKLKGTSMSGFRQAFIMRTGRIEQQYERWSLTVDGRAHDILLDSVPWMFKQIRLPWLKKYVQVVWHDTQKF